MDSNPERTTAEAIPEIAIRSILTRTGGFLQGGYTHTINAYSGCAFAGAICGTYCYAQHNPWTTQGRAWGLYGAKQDVGSAYRRDYARIKHPSRGDPKPLRVYMSSSTDPYIPQEQRLGLTRSLLEAMTELPPDLLVVQTRNPLVERDLDLIASLAGLREVWLSMTVETDMRSIPGLPPHATPPERRVETLRRFRERGISTQATVSPLLPIADPQAFAQTLDPACDRIILDHYLTGDGSPGGLRTRRTNFVQALVDAGFAEWTRLEKLWEVRDVFRSVLGADRVLIGIEGFNAVGGRRP